MSVHVDDEWRFKKIRSQRASQSAFAYKVNQYVKQKDQSYLSHGFQTKTPYSREVMVKITGGATSKKGIRGSIFYISHQGELEVMDSNGLTYKTTEELSDAVNILQENAVPFMKDHSTKAHKLTQNIVFSSPPIAHVTQKDMLETTALTLKRKYPHNYFVMSFHDETNHPHVHVILSTYTDTGERINIRKKDLRDMREGYCHNLINLGYDVKATRKYSQNFEAYQTLSSHENKNIYEVVDFGKASYQLDKKNKKNGYLIYRTSNNQEVTLWGKELLAEITQNKIQSGDLIHLKKVGHTTVKVPVYGKDEKTILSYRETKRNQWHIEKAYNSFHFSSTHDPKEVVLNSSAQAEKQLDQRDKFNREKTLLLKLSPEERLTLDKALAYKVKEKTIRF